MVDKGAMTTLEISSGEQSHVTALKNEVWIVKIITCKKERDNDVPCCAINVLGWRFRGLTQRLGSHFLLNLKVTILGSLCTLGLNLKPVPHEPNKPQWCRRIEVI